MGSGAHPEVIGCAVNPLLALINHSCDANYGRVWTTAATDSGASRAPLVTAYTTRTVAQGEELTDCYSMTFAMSGRDERRAVHSRLGKKGLA